jgi:hypothetical protein
MAWTQDDLDVIERMIAQGVLEMEYGDKKLKYTSLNDMLRVRDLIRAELGLTNSTSNRKYAQFNKGYNEEP